MQITELNHRNQRECRRLINRKWKMMTADP